MRMDDLNWMDVEKYLQQDDRLMLVVGATEQHGYLSLTTDCKIPQAMADAASQKTGVLVAPSLNFGVSPYFTTYPGTISLRVSTFLDVIEDVIRCLYGYGFRRILVVNGHGGNAPANLRLAELVNELEGLQVTFYSWWQSHSVEQLGIQHNMKLFHAGWMEAFAFTRVAELPQGEKVPAKFVGVMNAEQTRAACGDGVFGGYYDAPAELMDELFNVCVEDILHLLEFGQA
jgi:creatinine amidohydrolase